MGYGNDQTIIQIENPDLTEVNAQLADKANQTVVNAMAISRFLNKIKSGKNVSMTGIGDSIMEGNTTTTPATDKYLIKLQNYIQTTYGITVTLNNRAVSGYSVATSMFRGNFDLGMTDKADLYLISFGHNDTKGEYSGNLWFGYPLKSSIGATEHMIRRIRTEVPNADIILIAESPYNIAYEPRQVLINYNKELELLANMYSCLFVDCYTPFIALGDWSSYMFDSGHPNTLGHNLMYETIKQYIVTDKELNNFRPSMPTKTYAEAWRFDNRNWDQLTKDNPIGTDRYILKGTWSSSPFKTTTAGSTLDIIANASEVLFELTVDPSTTIMYSVNGDTLVSVMDINVYATGGKTYVAIVPPVDYKLPVMSVQLYLRTGGIQVDNVYALKTPNQYIPIDSPLISTTNMGALTDNVNDYVYGEKWVSPTVATGYTLQVDFIGTGIALEMMGKTTSIKLIPTIDGVSQTAIECGGASTVSRSKPIMIVSGLPYGKHTLLLTEEGTSTQSPRIGGFIVIDERRIETPRVQRGIAKVGQTVTYPVPFTNKPFLKVFGNGVYATSETAIGFTVSGTIDEIVTWEAEGSFVAY